MSEVNIDVIAFDRSGEACVLVLVEKGWSEDLEPHLRALQDRLYDCLDVAFAGQVAAEFPEARGKTLVIRVQADAAVRPVLDEFIGAFAEAVAAMPHYDCAHSPYVREIRFETSYDGGALNA